MDHKIKGISYKLDFKFDAGTSRGVLNNKTSLFIIIERNGIIGIGEAGPLPNLSIDSIGLIKNKLPGLLDVLSNVQLPDKTNEVLGFVKEHIPNSLPSLRFAFETALLDLLNGGDRILFDNYFSKGTSPLIINGLVWMGDERFMLNQIDQKLKSGFSCIKVKIGAIDFDKECALLKSIRDKYSSSAITIRVDANGAFNEENVLERLKTLATFDIHSIEQPVKQGQVDLMSELCLQTPIPIALDEELIGVFGYENKLNLLTAIKPQYIILKPTLLGGIYETQEWIDIAVTLKIRWWITSALESNIGLNAVSQFTAQYTIDLPQGLGTGDLYHNNFPSPLSLEGERLYYKKEWAQWEMTQLGGLF